MFKRKLCVVAISSFLVSCTTFDKPTDSKQVAEEYIREAKEIAQKSDYTVTDKPYVNIRPRSVKDDNTLWLRNISLSVLRNTSEPQGVLLRHILDDLNKAGLRITTTLPVDYLYYRGFSVPAGTDGLTALTILTEQMGADYEIVSEIGTMPYVRIIEMGSDDFTLAVPDVKTGLDIVTSSLSLDIGAGSGGSSSGGTSGGGGNSASSTANIKTEFWNQLTAQLEAMTQVRVPVIEVPRQAVGRSRNTPGTPPNQTVREVPAITSYELKKVGDVVVNPGTGFIYYSAPKHIRTRIRNYLEELAELINTRIVIEGRVISVTMTKEESRGISWSGFKNFMSDEYGLVSTNNVIGNVTISTTDVWSAVADAAITPTSLGIRASDGLVDVFNGYLSTFGETSNVTDFQGSVRSGRTFEWQRKSSQPRIETEVLRTSSDGVGNSSSDNETIYETTGTFANITPSYDHRRGMVNSVINIQLRLNAGEVQLEQPLISDGNISLQQIARTAFDEINITTEAPAKAFETIIVGGVEIRTGQDSNGGITGMKDTIVGGLTGRSSRNELVTKIFVLLTVSPVKYNQVI